MCFYIHCSCVSIQLNVTGYPVCFIVNSVYWTHLCNVSMHFAIGHTDIHTVHFHVSFIIIKYIYIIYLQVTETPFALVFV